MITLHDDIRDIFRAVRLGWSGKKIWAGLLGLLLSYAGYSLLVVIAHLSAGTSGSELWHQYGLFPGAKLGEFGIWGSCLHLLGMVWGVLVLQMATCTICKMTYQQLRGDDFYAIGDAWQFVKMHGSSAVFGPLYVLALFGCFLISGMILGWMCGIIPVIGEWVFALLFIPIFFVALLAVFTGLIFWVSVMLSPAIAGTVGEDAIEVVIQSFSLTWSQPWRLVLYGVGLGISVCVGFVLAAAFSMMALWLITWACGLFMDAKLANMFDVASRYLPLLPRRWHVILANLPAPNVPTWAERMAGRLLGGMLVGITGVLLAYVLSVYGSGLSLMYVVLRTCKDGERILERDVETSGGITNMIGDFTPVETPLGEETQNDTIDPKTT